MHLAIMVLLSTFFSGFALLSAPSTLRSSLLFTDVGGRGWRVRCIINCISSLLLAFS